MSKKTINVIGARQNNLKNISVSFPYYKLNVVTGCSGSGKSSLVYDTIYAESQRLMLESLLDNNFGQKIMEKPDVDSIENLCPVISISQHSYNFNPNSTVGTFTDISNALRSIYAIVSSDEQKIAFTFRDFLAEQSRFRCKKCDGAGKEFFLSREKMMPDGNVPLRKGGIVFFSGKRNSFAVSILEAVCCRHGINMDVGVAELSGSEISILLDGDGEKYNISFEVNGHKHTRTVVFTGAFGELGQDFKKINHPMYQKQLAKYIDRKPCSFCSGTGFESKILDCRICDYNIFELSRLESCDVLEWCDKVFDKYSEKCFFNSLSSQLKYIRNIIEAMNKIDIGYLSLDRTVPSLSGGEFQRLRLSKQIAGSLCEMLYILDEPCRGLHKIDIQKIKNISCELIKKGNTILAIEHNQDYISSADNVVVIGPGSGPNGGEICNRIGEKKESINYPESNRRQSGDYLFFNDIFANNINGENCKVPYNSVTFITGVSGSGKSTLASDVIFRTLHANRPVNCSSYSAGLKIGKTYYVDQNPIGKNARSTLISYLSISDEIRNIYSEISFNGKKYKSSFFSSNCEGGRCEKCSGSGVVVIQNNFFHVNESVRWGSATVEACKSTWRRNV